MANLYGAYRGAGKAGGACASSLQSIMDIEYEQEHSKQMFDIGEKERSSKFEFGQQALGLLSTFAGGEVEQEEAAADIKKVYGDKAEQTYGETKISDLLNPFKMEGGKVKWEGFGKAPGLGKGENVWGEVGERLSVIAGGKERKWNVSEGVKGVDAGEYKQSDLLAKAKQSTWDELGLKSNPPKLSSGGKTTISHAGSASTDDDDDKGESSDDCPPGQVKSPHGVCYTPYDPSGIGGSSVEGDEVE